jgi:hypothetical protein
MAGSRSENLYCSTKHTPDIDAKTVTVSADVQGSQAGDQLLVTAWSGKK